MTDNSMIFPFAVPDCETKKLKASADFIAPQT